MNISQVGTHVNYPIRAIDFDAENSILYTGDEMGWIQRWDLTLLFAKLDEVNRKERKTAYKAQPDLTNLEEINMGGMMDPTSKKGSIIVPSNDTSAFITGVDLGNTSVLGGSMKQGKIEFVTEDIRLTHKWSAHTDTINWITYAKDLDVVASCSFDCNVYMWKWYPSQTEPGKGEMRKVGSLVLGNERLWKIRIDKHSKHKDDQDEALNMLDMVESRTLDQWFEQKKKGEGNSDR